MSLQLPQAVAAAVGGSIDTRDAYCRALQAIAGGLGWRLAAAWEPNELCPTSLRCVALWSQAGRALEGFASLTRELELASGEGLPGRVWASKACHWVTDASEEAGLPRRDAVREAGLHAAVGFPVRSERGIIGIVEVFGDRPLAPDEELISTLDLLGLQLGQLVERRRAEDAGHAVQQRHRATLQAALDCVVTMDDAGRVLEFNPAAERTFGYSTEAAVGREMAELIVPEQLRDAHRRGLARYLATGQASVLERRIETEAVRADGTCFPVELTITRIDVPGRPTFTGQLRDITERRAAEAELRASRTRIVNAGDSARRRLERDLHDGAQQQLVSVAVNLQVARDLIELEPNGARQVLDEARADLADALAELRELARGIHPAVLTDGGLAPALRSLAKRSATPAVVVSVPDQRLASELEAAAYFISAEALTNAARHAHAHSIEIRVALQDKMLSVEVGDDGIGGARESGGGLSGLHDRVAALDGRLTVKSTPGAGTILRAELPCAS